MMVTGTPASVGCNTGHIYIYIYNDGETVCSSVRLVCGKQKDLSSIPASEALLSLQKL